MFGLRLKINGVLILFFMLGLGATAYLSHDLLRRHAREEVVHTALLMMEAASAIRTYTVDQVKPHLELQLTRAFLPQSVPAYAATETLGELRARHDEYREYSYKEATLNPTNPRDRPLDWEADLVNAFRRDPARTEITAVRHTPTGVSLSVARPIRITNESCLSCHGARDEAPETMIALYGDDNGFGWKMNEVVGAQIVSVPMSVAVEKADRTFLAFIGGICAVFLVVFVALNLLLNSFVIRRIVIMSGAADRISMGDFEVPEFDERGRDEIGALGVSFNRMRRSLEQAMTMIRD